MTEVRCSDCATLLPNAENPPQPCPSCGSEARSVSVALSASIGFESSISWAASSSNEASARARQLDNALADIEAGIDASKINEAQDATKRALEAIHELSDCLKRGEWEQRGWDAESVGLWHGLIGARNGSHHTSSSVVLMHSGGNRDERLQWDLSPAAIAGLHSRLQRTEYNARLAGRPVLPDLHKISVLVVAAVA